MSESQSESLSESQSDGQNPTRAAARSAIAERFSKNFFLACVGLALMSFLLIFEFIHVGQSAPVALAYSLVFFAVVMTGSIIGASIIEKRLPH